MSNLYRAASPNSVLKGTAVSVSDVLGEFNVTAFGATSMRVDVDGVNFTVETSADGGTTWIDSGYTASLVAGTYYTMNLDGTQGRLRTRARIVAAGAGIYNDAYVLQED